MASSQTTPNRPLPILIATTNPDKLREIRGLLAGTPVRLMSLGDLPAVAEPEETGATFEENARLKALYYAASLTPGERMMPGLHAVDSPRAQDPAYTVPVGGRNPPYEYVVAEDSGLEVDALDGEPGVRSARFVRPDATYPERFAEIERRLRAHPGRARTARFVCAVAVVRQGTVVYETRGVVEGEIAREPQGSAGFGYDPIFFYPPLGCTLAEVSEAQKLAVAHRGHAFRALGEWLLRRARETRDTEFS